MFLIDLLVEFVCGIIEGLRPNRSGRRRRR